MRPGFPQQMAPSPPEQHNRTTAAAAASTWRSPVPYLFGGLAAMLGLIAFALLILACSYWRISGFLDGGGDAEADSSSTPTASAGDTGKPAGRKPAPPYLEEGFVVIMAGDDKPTFLATPRPPPPPPPFGSLDSTGAGKVTGEAAEEKEGKGGEGGIAHQHQPQPVPMVGLS